MSEWVFEPEFWHQRFAEQTRWTTQVREYLFGLASLESADRILEVGCGTGAVLCDLPGQTAEPRSIGDAGWMPARTESAPYNVPPRYPAVFGMDINCESLILASKYAPNAALTCGDAHLLPYAARSFDIVFCHFTVLWLREPATALLEMRRVTRPGGWVLCLAEPDYGGRIDYPPGLELMGEWQRRALKVQGADPVIGRSLGALLTRAGLKEVQSGVLGGQWQHPTQENGDLEWAVLVKDFEELPIPPTPEEASALRSIDRKARRNGERLLYVPTFYAAGIV